MNQTQLLVVIVVVAVIAVAGILFFAMRKRRTQKLRERFGPEYDRVVKQEGDPRKAEGVLEFREQRREVQNPPTVGHRPIQFCGSLERSPKRVCRRSPGSGDCCGESGQRGDAGPRISNRRI
jgi:hypothetical protein